MAKFRLTIWFCSALVFVLGFGSPSHAQTTGNRRLVFSIAASQAQFRLPPGLLKNARFYSYQQIRAQTLADKSPDAAEVHTYLANPAQWQKNMMKNKSYELGLPQSRVILADGSIIRTYVRPQLPQGWRYHLFTDPPPKGFVQLTIYDATHLYEIQTPPGSPLAQQLQVKP
jgi:hypothetical protein